MGIEAPVVPTPPEPFKAVDASTLGTPRLPGKPAASKPASLGAISCLADDAAMRALPARNTEDPNYLHKTIRHSDSWLPKGVSGQSAQVVAYVYGVCYFQDAAEALATAFLPEHRIYLAGWSTHLGVQLRAGAGGTLEEFLRNTRAQVRGLFWAGTKQLARVVNPVNNSGTVDVIQRLPNGAALLDGQTPELGAHHQKILVVQGDAGLIAFIGGMDFMPNRVVPHPERGEPWSDVQVRLVGPAAMQVRKVFEDRWMFHPGTRALDEKLGLSFKATTPERSVVAFPAPNATEANAFETVTAASDSPRSKQRQIVAIGRTFGRAPKGTAPPFGFAPSGEFSAWSMIEAGIQKAVRWIYLEDQYMVSRMAREALLAKLKEPSFEYLLILMSGTGSVQEFKFLTTARNEFRRDLMAVDPQRKKWGMYTLKRSPDVARQDWCGDYVHSKAWIFDDSYAVVGSANCDNRGYTLDSEVVAGIVETSDSNIWLGKTFAIDLRTRLWSKYLGLPHADVSHFRKGFARWKTPPATAMVQDGSGYEDDHDFSPPAPFPPTEDARKYYNGLWTNVLDPDARNI